MFKFPFNDRLATLKSVILQFIVFSFLVRFSLYLLSILQVDFTIFSFIRIFLTGLFFDWGVISFFSLPYILYLVVLPNTWVGKILDKLFTYFYFFITSLIFMFAFFAEFTFWDEFQSRFNFIAVDYLIYTNEVVQNINESYPIPVLVGGMVLLVFLQFFIFKKLKIFRATFDHLKTSKQVIWMLCLGLIFPALYISFIPNNNAEWSENRYENELSKSGIYSFFAAFRNNELSYDEFYLTQNIDNSFTELKQLLKTKNDTLFSKNEFDINRQILPYRKEIKPNVIFICMESFSAEFLGHQGNKDHLTPNLDQIIDQGIYFENLYATGTRTVRGMEAIMLSVPPSPGRSIVKRKDNKNLYNIGDIFTDKGYSNTFFYGGDGYFDNMNNFFGANGFNIVDRGRGYLLGDGFSAQRKNIEDDEVQFENAWGISDEDIYKQVIEQADANYKSGKPFFDFVMTTSNHRPYTYPENKIDIPSGTGRNGAVKYTDFAIGEFIKLIQSKPWFENTVICFMADHCASSAGKWDLNVDKYHIPAIVYHLPNHKGEKINSLSSQIDFFPTLFGYLGWKYDSNFYGLDINEINENQQRAFIGNYRKLGLLKNNVLTILAEQKKALFFNYDKTDHLWKPAKENKDLLTQTIDYYQTDDYRYHHGLMKRTQ